MGSGAWIIETPDQTNQCTGKIHCPSLTKIQCPYRSELIGILGIVTQVGQISTQYGIDGGQIEIGYDGLGTITAI